MRRLLIVLTLLPILSATPGTGVAQQGAEQRPTISVETNLVTLPVSVVDRHGEPVRGLTEDRFAIFDNGQPQPIQFFTSEETPATVGLVVDCSSSMRGYRTAVTTAGTSFAKSGHRLDEFFSVHFNESVWLGLPAGVTFADNPDQLQQALSRAPARGMTALFDAVDRAMDHLQSGTWQRRALIVVSDGDDNASTQTLEAVLERARRSSVVIYAVMVVGPDSDRANPVVLRTLARQTGGSVFMPDGVEEIAEAFQRIAAELRSSYMIGFTPPSADAGYRAIRVVASDDGRKLTVRTRVGYYAGRTDH